VLADTRSAYRVLETSHPPVYYLPPCDVAMERLVEVAGGSYCEWKGEALYYSIVLEGRRIERAAWSYPAPSPAFGPIAGYVAFYASERVACFVDGERVASQPGDFYGGWITSDLIGPFKGAPGTSGW
jgi:uncharacterized protein (DUF427 family)